MRNVHCNAGKYGKLCEAVAVALNKFTLCNNIVALQYLSQKVKQKKALCLNIHKGTMNMVQHLKLNLYPNVLDVSGPPPVRQRLWSL